MYGRAQHRARPVAASVLNIDGRGIDTFARKYFPAEPSSFRRCRSSRRPSARCGPRCSRSALVRDFRRARSRSAPPSRSSRSRPRHAAAAGALLEAATETLICLPVSVIVTGTDITPSALLGILDRTFDAGAIAADHMRRAVDDGLRRVDVAIAAHLRIGFLARAETRIRQRVLPAEIIPVIDRHAQRDDGRILGELANDLVGGRTGRASLRCEQLDHRAGVGMGRTNDCDDRADAKRTRPARNTCYRPSSLSCCEPIVSSSVRICTGHDLILESAGPKRAKAAFLIGRLPFSRYSLSSEASITIPRHAASLRST